jgi:hypothetical protein
VEVEEVISDQIAGNECNKLPTAFYENAQNPMLMATRNDGKAYLGLKVNLGNLKEEDVPEKLLVGIRRVDRSPGKGRDDPDEAATRVAVKPKPSPAITYMNFTASTEHSDKAFKYEACWGIDENKDGKLQKDEVVGVFDKTPLTKKDGTAYSNYSHLRDLIYIVTHFHASHSKRKILDNPGIIASTGFAGDFIKYFAKGDRSELIDEAGATITEPVIIKAHDDGLSHAVGAIWNDQCEGQTFTANFDEDSSLSEDIADYLHENNFLHGIATIYADRILAAATLANAHEEKEIVQQINVNIVLENDIDLAAALNKVTISGEFKFLATLQNGGNKVLLRFKSYDIVVKDTYDFAYGGNTGGIIVDTGELARRAAIVQATYASKLLGNENGKVFHSKIKVEHKEWGARFMGNYPR